MISKRQTGNFFSVIELKFDLQSEERGTPSRRSKSEVPYRIPNGDAFPTGDTVDKPKTGNKVKYIHNKKKINM